MCCSALWGTAWGTKNYFIRGEPVRDVVRTTKHKSHDCGDLNTLLSVLKLLGYSSIKILLRLVHDQGSNSAMHLGQTQKTRTALVNPVSTF